MRQQNEITLFQIYNNSMKPDLVDNFECQFNRVMKSPTMSLWKAVYILHYCMIAICVCFKDNHYTGSTYCNTLFIKNQIYFD